MFAVGYEACFQSALAGVRGRRSIDTSASLITSRVSIGPMGNGRYGLAVELEISIPGVEAEV
ncbi:MAG TPA: hypothetical protein VMV09_00715, partial [Candidatus Saccharimonadales bacterium]|nr:hypothetical protein [Candidatus Saccharimonadales bacterium]